MGKQLSQFNENFIKDYVKQKTVIRDIFLKLSQFNENFIKDYVKQKTVIRDIFLKLI